jgi:16S rRNA (cytosine1402-N4)-methyltransferase
MNSFHTPVLLKESIELLQIKNNGKYIDATIGGGGHTKAILDKGGIVLGIDQDQDALNYVSKLLKVQISEKKLILVKANFKDIETIAQLNNFDKVEGILFDLGFSSYQIDSPERGFSFLREGPLDMRMDKSSAISAEVLVNLLEKGELNDLFTRLGQERRSRTISEGIVRARRIKAIKTTQELTKVIQQAYGIKGEISDFTKNEINKRVFQALRIAVNGELDALAESLPKAVSLLKEKARIAAITFHSLEDGIVKKSFKKFEKENFGKVKTDKPIMSLLQETKENSRAKSAKLRIFEKN